MLNAEENYVRAPPRHTSSAVCVDKHQRELFMAPDKTSIIWKEKQRDICCAQMTAVGFEPTPLRTGAWSQRLRPLGQIVLMQGVVHLCGAAGFVPVGVGATCTPHGPTRA